MSFRPVSLFASVSAAFLAGGCTRAVDPVAPPAASIVGERVVFPANAPQRAALVVAVAEPRATEIHLLNGRLAWDEEATVRVYSPVAGRVQAVLVALGENVAKDAPLARLNSPDLGQAQADFHKAEADLRLAGHTLTRAKDLFEHGAVARKELESAEDGFANAQSERERAAARQALYGAAPAGGVDGVFVLRAPLAGMVVEKNINSGQELRPDLMLANAPQLLAPQFVVSDPHRFWVILDVTELDMGLLQPGQELRVRSRAFPDRVFSGRLDSLGQSLDPATRTLKARGSVDNAALLLKAEMYVDVEIDVPQAGGATCAIASTAVFTKDGKHYLFVETAPGSFERREIEPGAESGGRVLVRRGLHATDRVLTEGSLLVEALVEAGGKS